FSLEQKHRLAFSSDQRCHPSETHWRSIQPRHLPPSPSTRLEVPATPTPLRRPNFSLHHICAEVDTAPFGRATPARRVSTLVVACATAGPLGRPSLHRSIHRTTSLQPRFTPLHRTAPPAHAPCAALLRLLALLAPHLLCPQKKTLLRLGFALPIAPHLLRLGFASHTQKVEKMIL
ncbi:hypothetical protein U1Q18_001253, partial [Sarracenia purpurea var. burkii]